MLTPKLIPIEQLEKADMVKAFEVDPKGAAREVPSAADKKKAAEEKTSRVARSASKYLKDTKGATEFNNMQKQRLDKVVAALEKAARAPHFTTSRERRARAGAKGTGFGAAAHTADTSWSQNMEKSSLYKAFGVQIQDRSLPSPLFLQKNIDLQKNMDEYLDVYDEILQKAGMDWDNVTDEDFARLEKIDLGRFFGRGKKEEAPKKESGDRVAAAERVQAGIREAQAKQGAKRAEESRRAGLSSAERNREDVSSSMKEVKEGKAERLARGIGRFAGRAKQKIDQRENIGRKIGEAKDAGIAAGKEGIARGKEGIAEGRRRGSAAADVLTTGRTRNVQPTFSNPNMGGSSTGMPTTSASQRRAAGLGQTEAPKGDAPGKQVTRGEAWKPRTPQQQAAQAGRHWGFKPSQKEAMQKAMISLQKFLDNDCGCEGDTLMQNKATKGFSDKETMAIREGTVRGADQRIMMPRTQAEVIRSGGEPKESSYDRKHGRMSRAVPQGREWSTSEPAKRFPSPKND